MSTQPSFSSDEVRKKIESLPGDIRALIYSEELSETIQKIGNAHRLHIDQVGILESEAVFLMLGFTEPGDFVRVLSERLPTDKVTAASIAESINNELLAKIRNSLKQLYPDLPGPGASTRPGVQPGSMPIPPRAAVPHEPNPSLAAQGTPSKPPLSETLPAKAPLPPAIPSTPPATPAVEPAAAPVPQPAVPATPVPAPDTAVPGAPAPQPLSAPTQLPTPPAPMEPVDAALSLPQTTKTERVEVGIPPATQGYKVDPYREPIE